MLGQPASSHTVCRPSRRTSDFNSVYSGPVLSLVLIQSGLRSMGVWLLRTSRRSSLRPAGSIRDVGSDVVVDVSLMICTVLRRRPRSPDARGGPAERLDPLLDCGVAQPSGSGSTPRLTTGVPAGPRALSWGLVASVCG